MAFAEWLPAGAGAKARRAAAAAPGGRRAPCRGALNDASRDPRTSVRGSRAVPAPRVSSRQRSSPWAVRPRSDNTRTRI